MGTGKDKVPEQPTANTCARSGEGKMHVWQDGNMHACEAVPVAAAAGGRRQAAPRTAAGRPPAAASEQRGRPMLSCAHACGFMCEEDGVASGKDTSMATVVRACSAPARVVVLGG